MCVHMIIILSLYAGHQLLLQAPAGEDQGDKSVAAGRDSIVIDDSILNNNSKYYDYSEIIVIMLGSDIFSIYTLNLNPKP